VKSVTYFDHLFLSSWATAQRDISKNVFMPQAGNGPCGPKIVVGRTNAKVAADLKALLCSLSLVMQAATIVHFKGSKI
jgi:hypothetical protein